MPLHYGKIFGIVALLTSLAFVLWQVGLGFFAGETFDKPAALPQAEPPLVQVAARLTRAVPWDRGSWCLAEAARSDAI
jgi:hypothetical protein